MLGTFANVAAIIAGGLIGTLLKGGLSSKISDTVIKGLALCVLLVGVLNALKVSNLLLVIIAMVVGAIVGEWLDITDEKLYEELLIDQEDTEITSHSRILRSFEKHVPLDELYPIFEHMNELTAVQDDVNWALQQLEHYVDGYQRGKEIKVN